MPRSAFPRALQYLFTLVAGVAALLPSPRAQGITVVGGGGNTITYVTIDHAGATTQTSINGINDMNQFVGIYDDSNLNVHGFLGQVGSDQYTPIDYPGAVQTYAFRINNHGVIVGTYFDTSGFQHGFVRLPAASPGMPEQYIPIDVPDAAQTVGVRFELGNGLGTSVYGLNDRGDIVGQYADKNGVGHGFRYLGGHFTAFTANGAGKVPGFFGGSGLTDINDIGIESGGYGTGVPNQYPLLHGLMVWGHQQFQINPPGSALTEAIGINNRLQVNGFFYTFDMVIHGFIYTWGKYRVVDVPGAVIGSTVDTVNNGNQFVGEYIDGLGITHGYIATLPGAHPGPK